MMNTSIWEEVLKIHKGRSGEAVLSVVVQASKGVPRDAGAKMLIRKDGESVGSVGGGAIENLVVKHALNMLKKNITTDCVDFSLGADQTGAKTTGMICGGEIKVYFEKIGHAHRLVIFGCGHIGTSLAYFGKQCGFRVLMIDNRKDFADPQRFSPETEVICDDPVKLAKELTFTTADYIVILTHQHIFDKDILLNLLKREEIFYKYIGMIGSEMKVRHTMQYLEQHGVPEEKSEMVYAPIGLDIGAMTPEELAVAIISEIIAVKYDKVGRCGLSLSGDRSEHI